MPSLVAQIQAEALDGKVPVTALLRRAKAAAVKLNQMESAVWIERELSGYPSGENLTEGTLRMSRKVAECLESARTPPYDFYH